MVQINIGDLDNQTTGNNITLDSIVSLPLVERFDALYSMSLSDFDKLYREASEKPFNERTDTIQEVIGEINARQIELINEKIANLQSLPKEDLLVLQGWIADNTQISGVNADLSRIRGDIDDLIQNMDNVTPNDFQFDFEIPSETNTPITLESLASMPVEERITALEEISLTDTYNLHKEVLQKDNEAVEKITQKIQNNEELTEEESAIRDIEIALADKAFMKMEGDKEKTTAEDLQTLVAYYSEKGHFDFAEKANARLAELQNTGNTGSEPTDTPTEENSEDNQKPSFNVEGYMDEHFLKHNLKKQLADIKLIKYHATNISEEDKPKVLEAIEKTVAQKASEVNSGKVLMLDYDEKYVWRDILREFASPENKEPDKEIMKALEDVNSDITSFEEEYGIDDAHMQSEEQIAQNIDAIKNLDKIDFFASIEEPKEKPWTAEQLKNWKELRIGTSDFDQYAGALRTENLSEEDKRQILEEAKNADLYNFELEEKPEIYGDCKFVLEELAKVYPDDEKVKENQKKLDEFLKERGTTFRYPEMAETAKYLDKINIKSDIQMFGRSDIKQNTPDSEIAKLKELARIETETYLANVTPAGQQIDDKAFAKEYSERLNKYILGVVVADRATKGAPKEDINLQKFFEGNGKIDINQSSCIGYFAAQSNRNTAAVNQTEGRRPGLKEKLASIKAKIENFDKKCTERYGTKYTIAKNLCKSFAWGAAYGVAATIGSPAVAVVATVSTAKQVHSFIKNYKHEKEVLKAKTGQDLSFGKYAWDNKLNVAGIVLSASTVGLSGFQAIGGNPERVVQLSKTLSGVGLAIAGANKQAAEARKQVEQLNEHLPKDQQKSVFWAGAKAWGVSALSFAAGAIGGNVASGAAAPYFANTETPTNVSASVPLQESDSTLQQAGASTLQQASDSTLQQASDSTLQQAGASTLQQASDSTLQQASDSILQQASDSTLQQASDSTLQQASDSTLQQASDSTLQQASDSTLQQASDSTITQILTDIERQEAQGQGSATVEVSAKDTQFWNNRANQFLGKENVDSLYSRIDSGEIKLPEGIESKEEFAYKLAMSMEQSPTYVSEALGIDIQNTRQLEAQIPSMTNEQFAKLGDLMNDYSDRGNYEGDRPFGTTQVNNQTNTENNTPASPASVTNTQNSEISEQNTVSAQQDIDPYQSVQEYNMASDPVFVPRGMNLEPFENIARQIVGNDPQAVEDVSFLLYNNAMIQNAQQYVEAGNTLNDTQAAALIDLREQYNEDYSRLSAKYDLPSQEDMNAHVSVPLADLQSSNNSDYSVSNDTVFIPEGMDIDLFVGPASQIVGNENTEAIADVSSLLFQNAEIRNVEQQVANGVELSDAQETRLEQLKSSYTTYYQELSTKYDLPPQETIDNYTDEMLDYVHGRDSSPAETLNNQNTDNNFVSFNENNNIQIKGINMQSFEEIAKQTVGNDSQAVKDVSMLLYYDAILQDVTQQASNGVVFTEEQAPQIVGLQALHDKLYNDLDAKYDLPSKEELSTQVGQTLANLKEPNQEVNQEINNIPASEIQGEKITLIEGVTLQSFENVAQQTVGNNPQAIQEVGDLLYQNAILQNVDQQINNGAVLTEAQETQIERLRSEYNEKYSNLSEKYNLPSQEGINALTQQAYANEQQNEIETPSTQTPVDKQPVQEVNEQEHQPNGYERHSLDINPVEDQNNQDIDLSSSKASNALQINENGDGRSLYSIKDANGNVIFEQQFDVNAEMKDEARSLLPEREPVTRENYQNQRFVAVREQNMVAELQTIIARDEFYHSLAGKEDLSSGEQAFMQHHERDLEKYGLTHDTDQNLTRVCSTTRTMTCDNGVSYSFDNQGNFHMTCENSNLSTLEARDAVYKDLLGREQENKPLGVAEKQFMQQHRENLQEQHMTYNHKGDLVKLDNNIRVTRDGAAYSIKANVSTENATYGFNQQNYLDDAKTLLGDNASAKAVVEVKSVLMNDDIYNDLKARVASGETFSESEQKAIDKFMTNHENKSAGVMEKYGLVRDNDGEVHRAQNTQNAQSHVATNVIANATQNKR